MPHEVGLGVKMAVSPVEGAKEVEPDALQPPAPVTVTLYVPAPSPVGLAPLRLAGYHV